MTSARPATQNRLAHETSPYLLQHAHNPVDWYPWGPEALERARREDKPIFLSIGYSACHWCHVMERECFEEPAVAALMNQHFVNIKVDREERPDLDEIYMKAVVAMSGHGGWPMSVFLTPDQRPFFGGTYFPPVRKYGRPSFPDLLLALSESYRERRDEVVAQATKLSEHVTAEARADLRGSLDANILDRSLSELLQSYDPRWGGFGRAPKFPHALDIRICLRHYARTQDAAALEAAVHTLERMACGGIYDQLGGGFHRYSTDGEWRIPHFEKMLYDSALLVPAYLEAHLVTGRQDFARIARECCEWMLTEMRTPEGGLSSAQDADSEGEEGRYFVWTPKELRTVLGDARGKHAAAFYDVTDEGNFEHGKSALWLPREPADVARQLGLPLPSLLDEMADARGLLLQARSRRIKPGTDDKVLVAWNALAISALAHAYQVLEEPRYLEAASSAARHILERMRKADGTLYATARAGRAHLDACFDDYAFLVQALIDLYESSFDEHWLRQALGLCEIAQAHFWDAERGGYFTTGAGHEPLIARMKNLHDGALPAGAGVQALNLLRLHELTSDSAFDEAASRAIEAYAVLANRHPRLFSQLLLALDFRLAGPRQVVISGALDDAPTQALLRCVRTVFAQARVVALATPTSSTALLPILEGRAAAPHPGTLQSARAFVCTNASCLRPVTTSDELRDALLRA